MLERGYGLLPDFRLELPSPSGEPELRLAEVKKMWYSQEMLSAEWCPGNTGMLVGWVRREDKRREEDSRTQRAVNVCGRGVFRGRGHFVTNSLNFNFEC